MNNGNNAETVLQSFEQLAQALAQRAIQIMPELVPERPDPLLTAEQAARRLGISATTLRTLVHAGEIARAPGLTDIRIRQSVADAYGKQP